MKRLVSSEIIQLMTIQVNYQVIIEENYEINDDKLFASKQNNDPRMKFTAPFGSKEDYFRFIDKIINYLFNVKKFKKLESNESNVSQDSHYIVFQASNGKQYRIDTIYDLRVSTHDNNNEYAKNKYTTEIERQYKYLYDNIRCKFINIVVDNKQFESYKAAFDYFVDIIQSDVIDNMDNNPDAIFK